MFGLINIFRLSLVVTVLLLIRPNKGLVGDDNILSDFFIGHIQIEHRQLPSSENSLEVKTMIISVDFLIQFESE